jgi:hypothetical protein
MSGMFESPLMVGVKVLLGVSLTVFVGALIAACGNRLRTNRR